MTTTQNKQVSNSGIGFFGLLTIVFITLKLTGYINWSWWWILAPLYMPLAVVLGIALFAFLIAFIIVILSISNKPKLKFKR